MYDGYVVVIGILFMLLNYYFIFDFLINCLCYKVLISVLKGFNKGLF